MEQSMRAQQHKQPESIVDCPTSLQGLLNEANENLVSISSRLQSVIQTFRPTDDKETVGVEPPVAPGVMAQAFEARSLALRISKQVAHLEDFL